jgi:nucleoside-diphosphate-sugar epimerase
MANYSKKILVTGASGLLGRELCRQLKARGHYVVGVDDESRFPDYSCADLNEYYNTELRDFLQRSNDFELIFHYAAVNGTKNFYENPTRTLTNNASADLAVYDFASSNKESKLVYASSSEVVSGSKIYPTPEDVDITIANVHNRRWSYMIPKIMMENLLVNGSVNYLILRYFNVFSEHTGKGHFVRDLLEKITAGNYELIGADETRSFCYVEDAISASIDLSMICDSQVINVGSDEEIDILSAANLIADKLGISVEWKLIPGLPGSTKRRVPDLSRLRKYLPDYQPRSFSSVLDRVVKS